MKKLVVVIVVLAVAGVVSEVRAEQLSLKIVGSAQPSCWSLEEIVQEVTAEARTDREKALALHKFGMAHQIHFIGPRENGNYMVDALKILGVYGYSLCGNNSATMCALYNLAGLEARRRSLNGHVVPEVRFEGRWNYIDTDMFGYVVKTDDLAIASVDDLLENPELFQRNSYNPDPFFPFDTMEGMQSCFVDAKGRKDHHPYSTAHLMNLGLRTRESVTCYYRPRNRFYISPAVLPQKLSTMYRGYWLEGPVRQNSLAWTDTVPAAYGNAVFEYRPDLRSQIFRLENPPMTGVKVQAGDRLPPLAAAGKGRTASLVVEMAAPWVIAGLQNDLTDFEDNSDGAVVRGWFWRTAESDENRILVSNDNARTWKLVWENPRLGAVPFRVDFTPLVEGCYHYLVKFEWVDSEGSGTVGLEGLEFETWAELSPMALPRLEPGENTMTLSNGIHRAFLSESHWEKGLDLWDQQLENLVSSTKAPRLITLEANKPGILTFAPGPGGIIDELRLAIQAQTLEGGNPQDVSIVLSLSNNKGSSWEKLAGFAAHPEHEQSWMWFNHIVKDRSLDGSRTRIKIEITGGGLDKVMASSLVRMNPSVPSALRVSHTWKEGTKRQTVTWVFQPGAENTSYKVVTPERKIVNESFRIEAIPPEGGE